MENTAKKLKAAIGEYCRRRVALGLCNEDQCEDCPVNSAYYMAEKDAVGNKTYRVFNINYSVTEEDVDFEGEYAIGELKDSLPKEFTFVVPADEAEYELDDILTDKISDETGFMVESFEYHEIITHGKHTFEVVDAVPPGYFIWEIRDMNNGYIPLAKHTEDNHVYIDAFSFKALPMESTKEIMDVLPYGYRDKDAVKAMKVYLSQHRNPTPGTPESIKVNRIKAALPYMEKVVWE